jgi:hypothetical protein
MALIIGLSMVAAVSAAVAIMAVANHKDRDRESDARYQVMRNHADDMASAIKAVCDRLKDESCLKQVQEYQDDVRR